MRSPACTAISTRQATWVVNIAIYLESLVEELETAMRASGREYALRLSAEPLEIATDKVVSIGVIVTELVTNAYKIWHIRRVGAAISA
jgi:two-component sensor histidine kinase